MARRCTNKTFILDLYVRKVTFTNWYFFSDRHRIFVKMMEKRCLFLNSVSQFKDFLQRLWFQYYLNIGIYLYNTNRRSLLQYLK